jgi:hypothetical protein
MVETGSRTSMVSVAPVRSVAGSLTTIMSLGGVGKAP